jgi:predicted metal-dependent hydrolase
MTYQLVVERSKRRKRSLSLEVLSDNTVKVVAPNRATQNDIDDLLNNKASWIKKRLQYNLKNKDFMSPKDYVDGDVFFYLGAKYFLKTVESKIEKVSFDGHFLCVSSPNVKKTLQAWYKERALDILVDRTHIYAQQMGLEYETIRIKRLKSRWGSCSSQRNINYNWMLIMAPMAVMDYVVVHELSHLVHMDHSSRFWGLVGSVIPEYKESTRWLKEHSGCLMSFY